MRKVQASIHALRRRMLILSSIIAVALVALLIYLLVFSQLLRVQSIVIARQSPRLDIEEAQIALAPLLGQHILFASEVQTAALLHESIPDIRSITLRRQYPHTIKVTVSLAPLISSLTIVEPGQYVNQLTTTGSYVHFLTDEGIYVYLPHAQVSSELPHMYLTDWGAYPEPGSVLIPKPFLEHLWEMEQSLDDLFGHSVTKRVLYQRAREYHLAIDYMDLWFDTRSTVQQQLRRYRLFLKHIPRAEVGEYIDLRLVDRVIYK